MSGGRQREFCKTQALDAAMKVFWKKGYIGASLSHLTEAMGINKPSLYSAYGDKEQLFVEAVNYYLDSYAKPYTRHLFEDVPLKQRIHNYMLAVLSGQCHDDTPRGCFVSLSVTEAESGAFPDAAAESVRHARDFAEKSLRKLFKQEISKGNLDSSVDPKSLAQYLLLVLHGTAAMARGGKSKKELEALVKTAVDAICNQYGIG